MAINNAIAAAAASAKEVDFPSGCFAHGGLIHDTGVVLKGAGDTTELRATNKLATYPISSWAVVQNGKFILKVSNNSYILDGSPIEVRGLQGYRGDCNPNGQQIAIETSSSQIAFIPSRGMCFSSAGHSGSVASTTPLSAIVMTGSGAQLLNMKITTTWTGARTGDWYAAAVLNRATDFVVDHIHIIGAAAPAYSCFGCSNGTESNSLIENTLADGFCHGGCAGFVKNFNNRAVNTGDDSFSVNSYQTEKCVTHDIAFKNDTSINAAGRGFETDGGANISFTDSQVINARLSCVFLHAGSGERFKMTSLSSIHVSGITEDGCGEAGVYVASDGHGPYTATNVTISNVTGTGIGREAIHLGIADGNTNDIEVDNCSFSAKSADTHPGTLVVGARHIVLHGVEFKGFGNQCIASKGMFGRLDDFTTTGVTCNGNTVNVSVPPLR